MPTTPIPRRPARTIKAALIGLLILGHGSLPAVAADADADAELSFGVVPQQAASKLARLWSPILRQVSERSGIKISFRTAPNIPEFERRVLKGEYDLAYMNPYHYTVFQQTPGYRAFAKQKDKRIRGIIVVRKDADTDVLDELTEQTLAFPAPAAFAASVLPRAALKRRAIDITPRYVSSHDSVYRAVAKGLYPAGGGIERTLANIDDDTRSQLRVLWRTASYTPHAIAAHPRIDDARLKRIRNAFLALSDSPGGRALLAAIKFKGIEPAQNSDWDDVRSLRLQELSGLNQPAGG